MALTVKELVAEVADSLDRPDITDRLAKQFQEVLREAHAIDTYRFDLAEQYVAAPFISSNQTTINTALLAKTVRGISKIETFDTYTGDGSVLTPYITGPVQQNNFIDISTTMGKADYFGFNYSQTWARLGNSLTLNGVNQSTTLIKITGVCWPTWVWDGVEEDFLTDSWIMVEADYMIKALLKVRAARLTQNAEVLQSSRVAQMEARQTFIQSFAGDSICL